ncbi:MAG TPA: methylmalonyl Co-A mutase-associated GTPase MeaB [Herpetosiphonaceae bacterium]|nr:methylmalonyl Co-A mutase-associated GTPase MeaB [Herpetosiphonaceae bacterium]
MGLTERAREGDRRALARVISIVENGGAEARAALAKLYTHTGRARVLGVTGPPGAGKSTLVNAVALELRARGKTVAIVAVDPTSPFTGGAVLGDRIRMQPLGGDQGVFVRSMASRGQLGGIARATADVVKVFDAVGFDVVIVETVGAGQAEVEIAREAHTVIVVEVPGLGDDVQAIKAGILEIADIFVVNKADRDGAGNVARQLKTMLQLGETEQTGWTPPILMAVASRGDGVSETVDAVVAHWNYLETSGTLEERERARVVRELRMILQNTALDLVRGRVPQEQRLKIVEEIRARRLDPYTAAERLLGDALGVTLTT